MNSHISTINLIFKDGQTPPQKLNRERLRVLKDLSKQSHFEVKGDFQNPYKVNLSINENKLIFEMIDKDSKQLPILMLSLSPYHRIIKDYFMMIDSYEAMRSDSGTAKLETIDMARRGIHNEAAEIIIERFKGKIEMDLDTARGFFTLICVLHLGSFKGIRLQ